MKIFLSFSIFVCLSSAKWSDDYRAYDKKVQQKFSDYYKTGKMWRTGKGPMPRQPFTISGMKRDSTAVKNYLSRLYKADLRTDPFQEGLHSSSASTISGPELDTFFPDLPKTEAGVDFSRLKEAGYEGGQRFPYAYITTKNHKPVLRHHITGYGYKGSIIDRPNSDYAERSLSSFGPLKKEASKDGEASSQITTWRWINRC